MEITIRIVNAAPLQFCVILQSERKLYENDTENWTLLKNLIHDFGL